MLRFTLLATLVCLAPLPAAEPEVAVVGLATLRVGALWDAPQLKEARDAMETKAKRLTGQSVKDYGLPPAAIERVTIVMFTVVADGVDFEAQRVIVVVPRKPIDVAAIAKATDRKPAKEQIKGYTVLDGPMGRLAMSDRVIVHLPLMQIEESRKLVDETLIAKAVKRDADRAPLLEKEKAIAMAAFDVGEFARTYNGGFDENGLPNGLPPAMQPLLKARVATATLALDGKLTIRGDVTFATAEDAAAATPLAELVFKQLQRVMEEDEPKTKPDMMHADLIRFAGTLLTGATVTVKDRTVSLMTSRDLPADFGTLAAKSVLMLERGSARVQSQNNLAMLAGAALNCANESGNGPIENICTEKGKPLLSWRVSLLPHLGEKELYDQFKLDEPWDSEHNKKLIAKMPKVFAVPTDKAAKDGTTFYQTFVGKKGAATRPFLQDGEAKGLTFSGVTDGLSNTIMIAETPEAVIWTKPDDLAFDPDGDPPVLGGHMEGGFNVAFGDGSTRFVHNTVTGQVLKALITANGGESHGIDE